MILDVTAGQWDNICLSSKDLYISFLLCVLCACVRLCVCVFFTSQTVYMGLALLAPALAMKGGKLTFFLFCFLDEVF